MGRFETVGLILLALNIGLSALAFTKESWFNKMTFQVGLVRQGQWYRIITAAFIHVDWGHLFFNMFSLYIFSGIVERDLGMLSFAILYFLSLVGGNLLALVYHWGDFYYRAVGASGAVSGVIYAAIALFPGMELAFIFIPIPFPAWVFGIAYILYSIYGMSKQKDNVGHEAHLGGAITGLLVALAMVPEIMVAHPLTIIYTLVPAVVYLVIAFVKPKLLGMAVGNRFTNQDLDDRFREDRKHRQEKLNQILEKINEQGENSLSEEERRFLENQ
jgi:membrane associated rhomboid family serine protease